MRKHARLLLARYLFPITGLGLDDLPDTAQINKVINRVEDMLMEDTTTEAINEYLAKTITPENIIK